MDGVGDIIELSLVLEAVQDARAARHATTSSTEWQAWDIVEGEVLKADTLAGLERRFRCSIACMLPGSLRNVYEMALMCLLEVEVQLTAHAGV